MKRSHNVNLNELIVFQHLEPHVIEALAKVAQTLHLSQGETLYEQGDQAAAFFIVQAGGVRLVEHTEAGRDVNLKIYGPGDVFGLLAISDRYAHTSAVYAVEESTIICIQAQQARDLMLVYPRLALTVVDWLTHHIQHAHSRIWQMAAEKVERRLARALLHFNDKFGCEGRLGVTQQDLAEFTGTTIESVNRTLRNWEDRGLIERSRKQIEIRDRDALSRLTTGGNPHYEDRAGV